MVHVLGLSSNAYQIVRNLLDQAISSNHSPVKDIIKMRGLPRQIAIVTVSLGMIITNLILSGPEDSNSMYNVFYSAFSPAVYTFAIWGPIFLGFIIFAIYQALPSHRRDDRLDAIAWPVIIACTGIALTPFVNIGVSNIVITITLLGLLLAYLTIIHLGPQDPAFSWLVRLPITLLFGWITAATLLNTFQYFNHLGIESFRPNGSVAASIFIIIATLIGLFITIHYNELVYGLILIWAFWGIVAAHLSSILIMLSTILSTTAILLAIIWILLQYRISRNASNC